MGIKDFKIPADRTTLQHTLKPLIGSLLSIACAYALAGTFVYVSNAEDGDISTYSLTSELKLTPGPRVPAAKLVMPMVASQDGRFLYASVRSKPFAVYTYAIDAKSGARIEP